VLTYVESPGLPQGVALAGDAGDRVAIRPLGLMSGEAGAEAGRRGMARPLAGGPLFFAACEVFVERARTVGHCVASVVEAEEWAGREGGELARAVGETLDRLARPRAPFAGIALDRARIIGVVNVTPDSFHDGGRHADAGAAIAHGESLIEAGADIIDVGGESTRPGSDETPEGVELERVLPVLRALAGRGAVLSIDTSRAGVMRAAMDAGAAIINDVTALEHDSGAMAAAAGGGVGVILMHMRGRPRTMQRRPSYGHAPYEVWRYLRDRAAACARAAIPVERIAVDPGIGFGKNDTHNLRILSSAAMLHGIGGAVVVGASRKSFIGRIFEDVPADARLPGSLAAAAVAVGQGVRLLRVHDVAETRQALALVEGCLADAPTSAPVGFRE